MNKPLNIFLAPIPTIRSGELAIAYLGRMVRWNGPFGEKVVLEQLRLLRQARGEATGAARVDLAIEPFIFHSADYGRLVAWAAEVDFETFLFEHTIQALFDRWLQLDWLNSRCRLGRTGAVLCPACVNAERTELGVPTWQRNHQMPGMYWCTVHEEVLHHVLDENAFRKSPSEFVPEATPVIQPLKMTSGQTMYMQRYFLMCKHRLRRTRFHPLHAGMKALWTRLGLRSPWSHRNLLLHSFPEEWLDTCFGATLTTPAGQHGWDNTARDRTIYNVSDFERMLLIAALAESDEDAILLMDM